MRSKAMKPIVMAVVLAAALVITGLPQAQSAQIATGSLQQLEAALNGNTSTQAATSAGNVLTDVTCIVTAATQDISKINACNNDPACKAGAILDTLVDVLKCINPNDPNLALYQCISKAVVDLTGIKTTCNGDQACVLENTIQAVVSLANCFGQGTGTSGN